jgi:hypothetical protein
MANGMPPKPKAKSLIFLFFEGWPRQRFGNNLGKFLQGQTKTVHYPAVVTGIPFAITNIKCLEGGKKC